MSVYSFLDVNAALVGPGGFINLGSGAGNAEEGITISATGDKNTMTIGADGSVMHSLLADKSGTLTVRLLKTSPTNQLLAAMYAFQTASASQHGQNVVTVSDARGDMVICRQVAFKKAPDLTYAKEGGMNEWNFDAGTIDRVLGA